MYLWGSDFGMKSYVCGLAILERTQGELCNIYVYIFGVYLYICIYLDTAVIQNVRTIVVLSSVNPDRHCPSRESDKRSNSQ